MRKVNYPHPGEILLEEFLNPMGITQYRLAKEIGVPQGRIGEIVTGKRSVSADTGLRLSCFFGMSEGFWIGLQTDYDTARTKDSLAATLARIKPWSRTRASTCCSGDRGCRRSMPSMSCVPPRVGCRISGISRSEPPVPPRRTSAGQRRATGQRRSTTPSTTWRRCGRC